jgi:hypothetical protein
VHTACFPSLVAYHGSTIVTISIISGYFSQHQLINFIGNCEGLCRVVVSMNTRAR